MPKIVFAANVLSVLFVRRKLIPLMPVPDINEGQQLLLAAR